MFKTKTMWSSYCYSLDISKGNNLQIHVQDQLNPLEFTFYNGGSIIFCNTRRVPLIEQDMLTLPEQLPHFSFCSILVIPTFIFSFLLRLCLYSWFVSWMSQYHFGLVGTRHSSLCTLRSSYFILIEENTICSIYSYQVELLHLDTIFHSLFVRLQN